jgi:hypothetical protein
MERPKREDYKSDVEFRIAYMAWRREQIAQRQSEEDSDA